MAIAHNTDKTPSTVKLIGENFRLLISNVVEISELQSQLFFIDMIKAKSIAIPAMIYLAVSLTVILGAVPVFLSGIALLVNQSYGMSLAVSLLIVGSISLVLAVPIIIYGIHKINKAFGSFGESRKELTNNLRWLREIIVQNQSE